jgi:hypothetical protein
MSLPDGVPIWWKRRTTLTWASGTSLLAMLVLVITLGLSQSSGSTSARPHQPPSPVPLGEVTGIASPCVGVTTLASYELLPVHVTLIRGDEVVSSETVTGDHRFLLAAVPGRYLLMSDQYQRPTAYSVVLHALQTVQVNLPVACR